MMFGNLFTKKNKSNTSAAKTYGVDIDGTLTMEVEGHDYANRTPNMSMIIKVRQWYHDGHRIILYSARREQDRSTTENWMMKFNVPYHQLILGKPKCDMYVDDVAYRPEEVCGV
jgi:uncharacterized HAD superfamily protein